MGKIMWILLFMSVSAHFIFMGQIVIAALWSVYFSMLAGNTKYFLLTGYVFIL